VGVRVVVGFDLMLNVVKLFLQPLHALFKCLDALFYLGVLMAVLLICHKVSFTRGYE
jgi:hypothetical protein